MSIKKQIIKISSFLLLLSIIASIGLYFVLKQKILEYEYQNIKKEVQIFLELRSYLSELPLNKYNKSFNCSPAFVVSKLSQRLQKFHYIVRQVSPNYRNKLDKPSELENSIFNYFKNNPNKKEIFKVVDSNNKNIMIYAVPLRIRKSCLKCHGVPYKDVPEKTYKNLLKLYGNRAFNYKIGDLRGILDIQKPYYLIEKKINHLFFMLILFNFIIFFISILLFSRLSKYIQDDIDTIHNHYKKYLYNNKFILLKTPLKFNEFDYIKDGINKFISLIKNSKKELVKRLYFNPLTNLPNRERLNKILKNRKASIMIVDIENFKDINVIFGYESADELIKNIAQRLRDIKLNAYHISIDSFAIVFYKEKDISYFNFILSKLNRDYNISNNSILVKFKAGVLKCLQYDALLKAELALEVAKELNRDIMYYKDAKLFTEKYKMNLYYLKEIKYSIENDKVEPFYQVITDKNKNIVKFEALIRIIGIDNQILFPDAFLEIAKKTRYYKDLTKIVIHKALLKFSSLNKGVSLNLTAEDLEDDIIKEYILSEVKRFYNPKKITFEIVESEEIKNIDVVIQFISQLKELGCKIYIDDFGSGYSNFDYLLKFNPTGVKIDGSLIKDILENKDKELMIKTLVGFAKQKGYEVVAEYVENEEIFNKLKEIGVDYFQGYYFSKPIRGDEIEDYISKWEQR